MDTSSKLEFKKINLTIDNMAYCCKCGTQLSDGAKFCPKCGNPCGNTSDTITDERRSSSKKPLLITLAVLVVMALLGGGWYFLGDNNTTAEVETMNPRQVIEEKKQFLEDFYKRYDSTNEYDEAYIKSNLTNKALLILKKHNTRDEGGDEADPNGMASWLFNYYNGWVVCGSVISRNIISKGGDLFLVSAKYENVEKYEVELSVIKDGDSYKIDCIKPIRPDNIDDTAISQEGRTQSVEPQEYNSQDDYKQKVIEYESQLVEIANEIERQCNQFAALSSGDIDPMTHGNMQITLTNNIYDLEKKAEKIFDNLIQLANKTGNVDAVSEIQKHKRQFISDAERMKYAVRDNVNGY